jgi:toxin-antitoxin system PIN domain toxin
LFVVDTNVLVYAADRSADDHERCRTLLERWRRQTSPWHLTWSIVYEFLRVTTHARVFRHPWKLSDAWSFVSALLASPGLSVLSSGERHAELLAEVVAELPDVRGNLVHDAHTAVTMREHGIRVIYTRDADFHRFPFLQVRDPVREPPGRA